MAEAQMLTVREVATLLRVSEQTVRSWLRDGTLLGVRPGGTKAGWRIPRSAIEPLLNPEPTQLPLPTREHRPRPKRAA
jgi:excisionase family DNA binding protein